MAYFPDAFKSVSHHPVMVKCAAFNCRSGYKPNRLEMKMFQKGLPSPHKKLVFAFPKKSDVRWISAVRARTLPGTPTTLAPASCISSRMTSSGN